MDSQSRLMTKGNYESLLYYLAFCQHEGGQEQRAYIASPSPTLKNMHIITTESMQGYSMITHLHTTTTFSLNAVSSLVTHTHKDF